MRTTRYHEGRHLSVDETFGAGEACPVCLSSAPRREVHKVQENPLIVMLACPKCDACSASRMPTPQALDNYYARYYAASDRRVTMGEPRRFARHVASFVSDLQNRAALRILDFVGGDGSLAVAIVKQVCRMAGETIPAAIDIVDYEAPVRVAEDGIAVVHHRELKDIRGTYDLILASAILEHIPDAHAAVSRLVAAAVAGTFMYARTPFILPIAQMLNTVDMTYPAHVHDMGCVFWGKFIQTFSLSADLVRSAPSLIETGLQEAPLRTILAYVLKLPARLELGLQKAGSLPKWKLVGGWEAVIRFR